MRILIIIFIVIPLTEMWLLFQVAGQIGPAATLALVVLTAVVGVQILRRQGLSTLLRANQRLQSGELPAQEIVEGMMLAGAGALLLTPGFITDTVGFFFLTGPLRRPVAGHIIRSGVVRASGGDSGGSFRYRSSGTRGYSPGNTRVYEGEFAEESGSLSDSGDELDQNQDRLH